MRQICEKCNKVKDVACDCVEKSIGERDLHGNIDNFDLTKNISNFDLKKGE